MAVGPGPGACTADETLAVCGTFTVVSWLACEAFGKAIGVAINGT